MKIFLGLSNIAGQLHDFEKGFQSLGLETMTAVHRSKKMLPGATYDYNLETDVPSLFRYPKTPIGKGIRRIYKKQLLKKIWMKALRECDIFLFMWSTFQPDNSDLELLKKHGKKVVIYLVGSALRWIPATNQEFALHGIAPVDYYYYHSQKHYHNHYHYHY